MHRFGLTITAVILLSATRAFAQDAPGDTADDTIVVPGSRIVRQDFQAISPETTVGSEQLELTATLTVDSEHAFAPTSWEPSSGSRLERTRGRGASSVRVIRACEINLALGDHGDCTTP